MRASAGRCGPAADRSGMTVGAALPAVNADALRDVIEPVAGEAIVPVGDGHRAYPPCAAAMGVRPDARNPSGGGRVRNALHIQTVNNRHGRLQGLPGRWRGIATEYLDNRLRWVQQVGPDNASHVPRRRNRQVMHVIWKLGQGQ